MNGNRCLIVTTHFCPLVGGAQTVYDALARGAPSKFHILTSHRDHETGQLVDGRGEFDKAAPYPIERMDRIRPDLSRSVPSFINRLKAYLNSWAINRRLLAEIRLICRREAIDCVCVGASEALMWLPGALKKRKGLRVFLYTHGEEFSQAAYSGRADERRKRALHTADGVVAVSSYTAKLLKKNYGMPERHIKLLNNGVDFRKFSTPSPVSFKNMIDFSPGKIVVAAGRMVERKGFDKLVEAWPKVLQLVPDAHLFLAGTGPVTGQIAETVEQNGLQECVHQLGFVPDDQLIALYQAADLFVMPNRTLPDGDTEGFGLVFLEAAAAGTMSIGGDAGGAVDAILDGETGLLINGENCDDISRSVSRVLLDDEMRERMARAAKIHAEKNDWHSKAQELLEFFDEL